MGSMMPPAEPPSVFIGSARRTVSVAGTAANVMLRLIFFGPLCFVSAMMSLLSWLEGRRVSLANAAAARPPAWASSLSASSFNGDADDVQNEITERDDADGHGGAADAVERGRRGLRESIIAPVMIQRFAGAGPWSLQRWSSLMGNKPPPRLPLRARFRSTMPYDID